MGLTNIADRLTPSTPIEITFGAQPVATGRKFTTIFGHRAASGGTGTSYGAYDIVNVGDPDAAEAEVDGLAGSGSEIGDMAAAFVKANSAAGRSNFPAFRVVLIPIAVADFGPADEAIDAVKFLRSDMLVSPYQASSVTLRTKLLDLAALISGPDRDLMGQFGTFATFGEREILSTALALNVDNKYAIIAYMQDSSSPSQDYHILAAAHAGVMMSSVFPYLPLNNAIIGGLLPPSDPAERIELDPAGSSESSLAAGLSPLYVDAAGNVRFVRTRTTRVTIDGLVPATAYFDWQDLVTLNDFREDVFLRLQQPDLKPKKASIQTAQLVKDEVLRIAKAYEAEEAFQAVDKLAPEFQVAASTSSRGRFDFKIPVNVIPGLHVIAGNIEATTEFDSFTL